MGTGAACALIGGWAGLRRVLRQPPLQTLRNA
jgi:putative ABC transport system permease protein